MHQQVLRVTKFLTLIVFLIFMVSLSSCDRAKKKKWLFAEIEVRDAITDEPIDAELDLYYRYWGKDYADDNDYEIEHLGPTSFGKYNLEKKYPDKLKTAFIYAKGTGYYYAEGVHHQFSDPKTLDLFDRNKGTIIYLYPIYRMQVTFENSNCFDATDELRFYLEDPYYPDELIVDTLTGCFNGASVILPTWSRSPYLNYIGFLKRNAVETILDTNYPLDPYIENQILIHY